jgi:hypothetical protein
MNCRLLLEILNEVFTFERLTLEDDQEQDNIFSALDGYTHALPGYFDELVWALWERGRVKGAVALETRDVFVILGPEGWRHKKLNDDEFEQIWTGDMRTPLESWFESMPDQ